VLSPFFTAEKKGLKQQRMMEEKEEEKEAFLPFPPLPGRGGEKRKEI